MASAMPFLLMIAQIVLVSLILVSLLSSGSAVDREKRESALDRYSNRVHHRHGSVVDAERKQKHRVRHFKRVHQRSRPPRTLDVKVYLDVDLNLTLKPSLKLGSPDGKSTQAQSVQTASSCTGSLQEPLLCGDTCAEAVKISGLQACGSPFSYGCPDTPNPFVAHGGWCTGESLLLEICEEDCNRVLKAAEDEKVGSQLRTKAAAEQASTSSTPPLGTDEEEEEGLEESTQASAT